MWMVRAGKASSLMTDFLQQQCIAVGFQRLTDLTPITDEQSLKSLYDHHYPEGLKNHNKKAVLRKFRLEMAPGDAVLSYDAASRRYLSGTITSDYQFSENLLQADGYNHIRTVNWQYQVNRDDLSKAARNSLSSTLTVFVVKPEVREELDGLKVSIA